MSTSKISFMSHLAPGIKRLRFKTYEPNFYNPLLKDSTELNKKEAEELMEYRQ
jgi:hypothetical protein